MGCSEEFLDDTEDLDDNGFSEYCCCCSFEYDEIDFEYQICHLCKYFNSK